MLTGYFRLKQDGIKSLKNKEKLKRDQDSSHYYFDTFRGIVHYHYNKKEKSSGIGLLSFAPNGYLWSQTGEYGREFDIVIGSYLGIELLLQEAKKSKSKNITIYLTNKKVADFINQKQPFNDEPHQKLHNYIVSLYKGFDEVAIKYRGNFPNHVVKRYKKEAIEASNPPLFSISGSYTNASNKNYFNVGATEEEEKELAKQFAHILYDHIQSYFKEYKEDYGQEALDELIKKSKNEEIKDLPKLKRHKKKEEKRVKIKNNLQKKKISCHNCGEEMELESTYKVKPENCIETIFRCHKCWATRILVDGRTKYYGRYPKNTKNRKNFDTPT